MGALDADHVSITVNDFISSLRFGDAVMATLDVPCVTRREDMAREAVRKTAAIPT